MNSEEAKEIYAHFGLTFYSSNCLEQAIINALYFLEVFEDYKKCSDQSDWENLVDKHFSESFKKTLGQLKKKLLMHKDIFQPLINIVPDLDKCLDERNFIAHHFYREYAQCWFSERGRREAVERLQTARELFRTTDKKLECIMKPLAKKYGFTDKLFEKVYAEIKKEAEEYS